MHLVRTCVERAPAEGNVVVLADREDRPPGRVGDRDGRDPVVRACGEVHDDPIDVRQRALESRQRSDRDGRGACPPNQVGKATRPDQVVGKDRDPGRQSSVSAR
jgi:hypothetical protein